MNCLITKQGRILDCGGITHDRVCERELHLDLDLFLSDFCGVRIKVGSLESIAIEFYYKPSDIQMRIIRKILRENNYYTVILVRKVIRKFRPIRGIE